MRAKLLHFILRGHNSYENSYCRQESGSSAWMKTRSRKDKDYFCTKMPSDKGRRTSDEGWRWHCHKNCLYTVYTAWTRLPLLRLLTQWHMYLPMYMYWHLRRSASKIQHVMGFGSCMLKELWMGGRTDGSSTFRLLQLLARNDVRLGLTKSFPSSHICVSIQPAQSWSPAWSEKAFSGKNFPHKREARWAFTRGPEIVLHSPLVPWYCAPQVGAKINLRVK